MSKISTTKKIATEEFPKEIQAWIGKLINPLNKFFEQSYFAIAKGLTIADNLKAQQFNLDIAANQSWPMKVAWTLNEAPTEVRLSWISENPSGGVLPVHSMQWTYNNGSIEVTISGLTSSKKYKARITGQV